MTGHTELVRWKRGANFLTIEIGEEELKVALVKPEAEDLSVLDLAVADISGMTDEDISGKLRGIISGMKGTKKSNVISVLPSDLAIFKNIEIPSVDDKEINSIIDLQASRHTPYSREEVILDYLVLGKAHESYTKTLLVIVKRDVAARRYDIILNAGIKSQQTMLSAELLAKFFYLSRYDGAPAKPVAVVNIDTTHTDFVIEHGGDSIYIRSFPVGSKKVKTDPENTKKQFIEELKRSWESYQAENIDILPEKIYLTGLVGGISGSENAIQELIGVNCEILPEYNILKIDQSSLPRKNVDVEVSLLSVIVPPGVIDSVQLDLVPEDVKGRKQLKKKAREMTRISIMAMATLVVFCMIFIVNMFCKKLYLHKMTSGYTKEVEEAGRLKAISEKTDTIDIFVEKKGGMLFIVTELFNALPLEVYLNGVILRDDKTVSFTGTTDNMSRVFSLVTSLENNKLFSNVKVDSTRSRRVNEKEVSDFGLTLSIEGFE